MTSPVQQHPEAYYLPDGGDFMPTGLCKSPWDASHQNGVALGLLMSHTLASEVSNDAAHLARFTLDILRPAPATRTRVSWRMVREGRRVSLLEGVLEAGGQIAARANALFVAPTGPAPPSLPLIPPPLSPEDTAERTFMPRGSGLDSRVVEPDQIKASNPWAKHAAWVRVSADIVPGIRASGVDTAMAAADTGGAALREVAPRWNFPNLDIALHLSRTPRGEWVYTETWPLTLGNGVAVIDHHLFDREGSFARAHQTLFFTPRQQGQTA